MKNTLKHSVKLLLFISIFPLLTTCNDFFSVGLGKAVDLEAPSLSIENRVNGEYVGGIISITGIATDDKGVNSVTLYDGTNTINASMSGENWSLDLDTTQYPDGEHEFVLTAQDIQNKSVSIKLLLVLDNNPPSVMVTTPADYGPSVEFNKTLVIKGEAADAVRLKEVRVSVYDSKDQLVVDNEPASGKSSWYYSIDTVQRELADGQYYFFITAEDYSGNKNTFFYHFKDVLDLALDRSNIPSIEEIDAADNQDTPIGDGILSAELSSIRASTTDGERIVMAINQNSDLPQFTFVSPSESLNPDDNVFAGSQRLIGYVEDDDGVDYSTVKIAIWAYSANPAVDAPVLDWTSPAISGSQWSYNTSLSDGKYQILVRAKDIYGNPATAAISNPAAFKVSSQSPTVTITAPAQGSYLGPNSTLNLQVNISNLPTGGVVQVDPEGDDIWDASTITMTDQGGGVFSAAIQPGTHFTLFPGPQYMKIRAGVEGNYGTNTLQYTGDTQVPAVSIEYPVEGDVVNGNINIAGISSDDNLIDQVYIWLEEIADPSTAPPADVTTWKKPDGTDVYNWIYAVDTSLLSSGIYRFHATVFDSAGNQSTVKTVNFTVNQESDRPVISLSNVDETAPTNGLGRDATIIGIIKDDDGVDASTLEIRIDVYNDGSYTGVDLSSPLDGDTTDVNETEQWVQIAPSASDVRILSWSYVLLNLPQGAHGVEIRVHDINSDGTTDEGTNPNYAETQKFTIVIDYGPPDLVITVPPNGSIFNNDFSITGTAADPNNINLVEVSMDNGSTWTDLGVTPDTNVAWSYNFTVQPDGSTDGDYQYQVRATDSSGAKTTLDRQLTIDATAPTATIANVTDGATVNGLVPMQGGSNDNVGNGYVGIIDTVYLDIRLQSDPAPVFPGDYTDLNATYSWVYPFDSTAVTDDVYIMRVVALDVAGNASPVASLTFTVDQNSDRPVISFSDIDKDETDATQNVLVGATSLTGLVEDDDGIDPTLFAGEAIEINIDNAGWVPVSQPPAQAGLLVPWKHDISGLTEGLHYVKVRARDKQSDGTVGDSDVSAEYAGNYNWNIEDSTDQNGVPFILNLGPPSINITSPVNYSYHSTDVTISGGSADANGVKTVEISYDNGQNWDVIFAGAPPYNVSESWSTTYAVTGSNDGTVSYIVRVTDAYGSSSIENGQFTVDATAPTVTIKQPDPLSIDTFNGNLTIEGIAGDNISLSKVYYEIRETYTDAPTNSIPNAEPVFPDDYTLFSGKYSWSEVIDTTPLTDESYTLRVVSVDDAGNVSDVTSAEFVVDQTTDRPIINYLSISEAGDFTSNLLPGSKQVSGTVTDDDSVKATSIQYQLYQEDGTTLITDWTDVSGQPGVNSTQTSWSHTFTQGDGKYQMKLRAADIYDNGSYDGLYDWNQSGLVQFSIDTANPETTFNTSNGGYSNTNFTIGGTASDANGITNVEISFDDKVTWDPVDSLDTATGVWSHTKTIDTATHGDDGVLTYSVRVTDTFGKTQVYDRYITVDTQIPEVNSLTLVALVDNDLNPGQVNGSALLQGFPNDSETLVSAIYVMTTTTAPGSITDPQPDDDPTLDGWTLLGSTSSINYRFNTTLLTDNTTYYTYVIVEDLAGNRTYANANYVTYLVKQSNNIPVITLDTADNSVLASSGSITGTVTDDDGVDHLTIQYSTDGTNWFDVSNQGASDSTSVEFSHSMADFAEQADAYTIQFRAYDLGEDFTDDSQDIAAVQTNPTSINIYIDNSNPTAAITQLDNGLETSSTLTGIYVNDQFTITGTATDDVQVAAVRAKLAGDANFTDYPVTNTGTNYSTWSWARNSLVLGGDSVVMTLQVEDIHGKTTEYNFTLLVDTTPPTVTISSSASNPYTSSGAYNGTATFRGTASDNIQITKVYYAFGTSAPTTTDPVTDGWTLATGTYSWSLNLDTVGVYNDTSDHTYYLGVVSVDGAGIVSSASGLTFTINQASDYPVLTIDQPTEGETLQTNAKVSGTLTDDDGLTGLQIRVDTNNDGDFLDGGLENYTAISTPATVSGTSINFEEDLSSLGDGSYRIQLRASDSNDNQSYATTYGYVESSVVSFDIDTEAPSLALDNITIDDKYPLIQDSNDTVGDFTVPEVISSSFNGSYIYNDFALNFSASDASGIASVQTSIDGGTSWSNATDNGDGTFTANLAITGFSEGTNTIYYRATDGKGKTTSSNLTIIVDTGEPTINFSNPTSVTAVLASDAPNVNGDVTIRGSVTDSSSISSLSIVGGINGDIIIENTGNTINWIGALSDNDASLTSDGSSAYANSSYSYDTDDDGSGGGIAFNGSEDGTENHAATNIWRFPITVTAIDLAGNLTETTGYIDIDPDSDNPIVNVVSPSNGASVSGTFLVNGTLQDDDGTDYVTMQFDFNDDGVWDGTNNLDISNDLNGNTLSDDVVNETTLVQLDAPNGSWSIALNASDFTDAKITAAGYTTPNDGFIRLLFTPYDINGLAGVTQTVRIYLDTTSPSITTPTPASGTLQKGTITLTTQFQDDKQLDLNSMLISYDGGATFSIIDPADISGPSGSGPYTYDISIDIDTATVVSGGNGLLDIQLSLTDQTNKQTTSSVTYSVDNTVPTIAWNEDGSGTLLDLPFIGTPPNEIYTYKGNDSTGEADDSYKVLGAATDTGIISGIDKIVVYFVKSGSFWSPNTASTSTVVTTDTVNGDVIPYTLDSTYAIIIDNRIEQGQFDQIQGIGDSDGYNESLKTKSGYDEWYAFFDTTNLPDGPLEIYSVVFDEAGNRNYTVIDAQIANNPPTIPSISVAGTTIDDSNDKVKVSGSSVNFTIDMADAEGIDVSTLTMEITGRYDILSGEPNTLDDTYTPPAPWTSADFDSISPGTDSTSEEAVEVVDSTAFASSYYYRYLVQVYDTDGNLVERAFYVWVNNEDSSAPTVTLDDFSQSSVSGGNGHVEEEVNSLNDTADADTKQDADLSGIVTLSGTAYDDSGVSALYVDYSLDGGTNWTTIGTETVNGGVAKSATLVQTGGDIISGYDYSWTLDWDTSTIEDNLNVPQVAKEDVLIRAYATDGTNSTLDATPPELTVDIVPYITSITGAGFDSGLLTYVRRSAQGRYPISTGSTITITGYNLPGTDADGVSIGNLSGVLNTDYYNLTASSGNSTSITVPLGATDTSGEIVINTNGVSSLNNSNDNSLPQNKEASSYNDNLTDDREIVFWDVSTVAGTSSVSDPYMSPNADGTDFEWMYVKSGKDLYHYNGTSELMLTGGTGLKGGAFTYNSSGSLMFLYNHNSQWSFYQDTFAFTGSVQFGQIPNFASSGYTFTSTKDEAYNWNQSTNFGKLGLGNNNFNYIPGDQTSDNPIPYAGYDSIDLNRYENLKIRTVGNDTLSRNYVAYFDTGAGESRSIVFYGFQTSTISGNTNATAAVWSNNASSTETHAGGTVYANIDKYTNSTDTDNVALAGTQKNNNMGIATPRGRQEVTTAESGADSAYFDLQVYELNGTTHYGYIAYFDENLQSLKITANESLYNADPTGDLGSWTPAYTIETNAGAYVAMAVDPNGGIHLAYQDVSSGYLKYSYLTYDDGATAGTVEGDESFTVYETVFVDALFGAGSHNSIVVRDFGSGDYRPVIVTFSSAFTGTRAPLRLSYPVNAQVANLFGAGADSNNGKFLGNWETIALMADSNPSSTPNFLYLDSSGNPYLGYMGSTLEEAFLMDILD